MSVGNILTNAPDVTTDYFNNFYGPTFTVSQNVDEAITSFFEKMTNDVPSAKLMAGSVIYTAKMQNLDPMIVLQQLAQLPKGQLNGYITMFLNLNRVGTSLLGLSNAPITNKYLTRAILP